MVELYEYPQRSRVIIGFPGFGLIGTITTEYLIEHLDTRLIGKILFKGLPTTLAIHNGKIIDPIGIYYNEKYNMIIIRGMASTQGIEWEIAEEINMVMNQLNPYEIIDIEGVASQKQENESKVYFFTNSNEKAEKLKKQNLEKLNEGIVIGVTSSILLKIRKDIICLFAETHSELPDSKAAAKIIESLDKYIGLEIDYQPLLEQAEIFEQKLKSIIQNSNNSQKEADKKTMNYVG